MSLNPQAKRELKSLLATIGDEKDAQEMSVLESSDIKDTLKENNQELKDAINSLTKAYSEGLAKMQQGFIQAIEGLKKGISTEKQPDWSGFFKDMPTMLTQIGQNTGQTSELIRNLKWNASQQLRNVNGSPINPAIAPFAISSAYDEVQLSNYDGSGNVGTVQYYQAGNLTAELALTYDGSGNLTDVQRTK